VRFYIYSGILIFLLVVLNIGAFLLYTGKVSMKSTNSSKTSLGDLAFGTFAGLNNTFQNKNTSSQIAKKVIPSLDKDVTMQKISNVGYDFYLGQLDYPKSPALSDDVKNAITQVIYKSQVPKRLLGRVGIVVVNTLAITNGQKINTPNGLVQLPSFPPAFLTGGGLYHQNNGPMSLIYINSKRMCSSMNQALEQLFGQPTSKPTTCYVDNDFLSDTLTHELAHFIGNQMTDAEWAQYYKLRYIPSTTPRSGDMWETSPEEDFAEVYKNTYTGKEIRTVFGKIEPDFDYDEASVCRELKYKMMQTYSDQHVCSLPFTTMSCYKVLKDKAKYDSCMADYKKLVADNNTKYDNCVKDKDTYNESLGASQQIQDCRRDVLLNPEKYKNDKFWMQPYNSVVDQASKDFVRSVVNRLH
jgi:hypothetical protein